MKTFKTFHKDELIAKGEIIGSKVCVERYCSLPGIQQFYADEIPLPKLAEIFEMRLWPRNRENIDEILKALDLKEYDVFKMIQITHGVMRNDFVWFSFDDEELTYEDVRIR